MPLPSLPPSASGGPSSQMEVRQYTQQLAANLDAGRVAQAKVLESVKFELDVRGSLLEKQLEAVREEMQSTMVATEKKWLDIAKGVETSTSAAIAAESKLREHSDKQLGLLRDASATAHQETLRAVSEFQQTAIDHSEVLRRLDADLNAFRQSMETRYAKEARKLAEVVEDQEQMQRQLDAGGGAPAPASLSTLHEARLAEVEAALLSERDFRRALELQIAELREKGGPMSEAVEVAIESAVGAALERTGTVRAAASLDEKVKECGRLIVRMGTELMEETKRRQSLEAEVQELRMRLSGVEAVARSPLGTAYGGAPPYGGMHSAPAPEPAPYGTSANLFGTDSYQSGADAYYTRAYDGGVLGGDGGASAYVEGLLSGSRGGVPPPFMVEAMAAASAPPTAGPSGGADPNATSLSAAVDSRLRELVPSIRTAAFAAPAADAYLSGSAHDEPAPEPSSQFGQPSASRGRATASLRISRQELDARVQQILGKHGHGYLPSGHSAISTPGPK
jgi:hypothetical protein|eukprot:jgi/Chrpa1/12718/Chrysochromulina_OHIO_Genome00021476-RA